jgi:GT2 family glycosyltransferase
VKADLIPGVWVVISTWNKADDLRENLDALEKQTRQPEEIIVKDNASKDETAEMVKRRFPEVKLIIMPDSAAGACETFNIGFKAARHEYTVIMDDDVVAPPDWLEKPLCRFEKEPATTAMISSKVIEPEMPESFLKDPEVNSERYMATFRGCGSIAKTRLLAEADYYDEKFFIYGNERDLAARILNLGYRILQFPSAEIYHKTPFGMQAGKRSLYYHARYFWLYTFKNCSWGVVVSSALVLGMKGLGFRMTQRHASDATGTIGIERSLRETPGGLWIALKATLAAFCLLPYCLSKRRVCRSPDFKPPF